VAIALDSRHASKIEAHESAGNSRMPCGGTRPAAPGTPGSDEARLRRRGSSHLFCEAGMERRRQPRGARGSRPARDCELRGRGAPMTHEACTTDPAWLRERRSLWSEEGRARSNSPLPCARSSAGARSSATRSPILRGRLEQRRAEFARYVQCLLVDVFSSSPGGGPCGRRLRAPFELNRSRVATEPRDGRGASASGHGRR